MPPSQLCGLSVALAVMSLTLCLEGSYGCYAYAVCAMFLRIKVSDSCPVRVRFVSGMSGFKLDILDMDERDTVRSCPVMSENMSGDVR